MGQQAASQDERYEVCAVDRIWCHAFSGVLTRGIYLNMDGLIICLMDYAWMVYDGLIICLIDEWLD